MADCKEGPRGPMGLRGPAGPQGAAGVAGAQGPQGIQGAQGIQGKPGVDGAKGDKGDKGDTGAQGPAGIPGSDGDRGPRGFNGTNGIDGADGPLGPQGVKGDKGDTGAQGVQGISGTNGTTILGAYNDTTGIGNSDATGDETLFHRVSMTGNTLLNNGDEIEIFCYMEYTASDTVNLIFRMDALNEYTYAVQNADNDVRFLKITIARIDQNNQIWTIEDVVHNLVSSAKTIETVDIATTSYNLALPMTFDILADNLVLGANQLILKKSVLYKRNA